MDDLRTPIFATDDGHPAVLLPPDCGFVEGDDVLIERRDDGVIVISRVDAFDVQEVHLPQAKTAADR